MILPKLGTSVSIPLKEGSNNPIYEDEVELWVDLDMFPWSYGYDVINHKFDYIPEELVRIVCPDCGTILITMKEIRDRNLWSKNQFFWCPCGFHNTKPAFLFSYDG